MKGLLIAGVAMLGASVLPAQSQTMLDKLIQQVGRKKGASGPTTTGGRFSANITPAQSAAIDRAISQPISDARVDAERTEAVPVIRALLETGSCAQVSTAWNAVNRWHMTPKSWNHPFGTEYVPMGIMPNHDKRRCLTVVRTADWTKPAENALRFRTFYLADDSGDARRQDFELQKASDGQWMIREIGMGLR